MEYDEIVMMIKNACGWIFNSISKDLASDILQCATQIYIKQMELEHDRKEQP